MPATTLTSTVSTNAGVDPGLQNSDQANGNRFRLYPGRTLVLIENGDVSTRTATIPAQVTSRPADGRFPATTVADIVVAVPAGAKRLIGPLPAAYADANGYGYVNWSASTPTDTQVAPIDIPA